MKRWHIRASRETRALKFATILERKTRSLLQSKFIDGLNKKNDDYTLT